MSDTSDTTDQLGDVIVRFDHVSIAVRSIESASNLLELIGASHFDGGLNAAANFRWAQYRLPSMGVLEVITPVDPSDSSHFINRFIAERGEGVHHLTFKVANIEDAVAKAEQLGFNVVGFDASDPEWKEAFVHPKSANGVLVQLAEFTDMS